jgi:hypothetical protein
VDRCYRIGQDKNVVVYRLITCSTIEEKIYRKQVFKDSLSKSATEKSNSYRYFSKEELSSLFELEDPKTSQTQIQLAQLHEKERKLYPGLQEHVDELNDKKKFSTVFGLSDHDLLFKQASNDSFDEEVMSDVIKSIQSLNVGENKSSTSISTKSGKKSSTAGPIKKNTLTQLEKEKMYKCVRQHGEKIGWMKISTEIGLPWEDCKKMWEEMKNTTPYEELVTNVLKYNMNPPWPEITRSSIMVTLNRVAIAPKPITKPIQTIDPPKKVEKASTVHSSVNRVKKVDITVSGISPIMPVPSNDDTIVVSRVKEIIDLCSRESTPTVVIDKENQVPILVEPDLPVEVEEPEDSDEEKTQGPEEILKDIQNEEGVDDCPETPEAVGRRLSLCFGLLGSQPKKRMIVLSDDEEDSVVDDTKKVYHEKLNEAFMFEKNGELGSALSSYMDAFDIIKEDEKLAFKIKQLAIELGLE